MTTLFSRAQDRGGVAAAIAAGCTRPGSVVAAAAAGPDADLDAADAAAAEHVCRQASRLILRLSLSGRFLFIMGGDWNCTTSCEHSPLNDDIINMRTPPNLRHSILLKNLCQELNLADPYRVKFPHRKEFTFVPKDTTKLNPSRIDFFTVSKNLIGRINKCGISPNMQNKMFDHRAVTICFKDLPKVIKQPTISRELLKDPDLELHVLLTVADTYLLHTSSLDEAEVTRR